jgi:hypothetical protein
MGQYLFRGIHSVTWHIHFFSDGCTAPWGPRPPHFSRLHDPTLFRRTTLGRTPLDEWSVRRRDLCLTTHNTLKRQARFELTIPVSKRPQTHALDRAATGIGPYTFYILFYVMRVNVFSLPYDSLFITKHMRVNHDLHVSVPRNTVWTNGWIFMELGMYVRRVITDQRTYIHLYISFRQS